MNHYHIVPLTTETIPGAAAVEAACFSQPWSEASLRSELEKEGACCFVAVAASPPPLSGVATPVEAAASAPSVVATPAEAAPSAPLRVLGWAGLEAICVCQEGSVTNIAVLPEARGQGVGKALTQALLTAAQHLSLDRVLLEVRVSNAVAITLYEQLGFVSLGIRPNFYDHPREDAQMMQWSALHPQPEETICP